MENKINIAELLKDCPQGMELDCTVLDNIIFDSVSDRVYPIKVTTKDESKRLNLTKYGCTSENKNAKCVIFPKGKTTWEGFQRPFKDGDIVFYNDTIAIFKEWGDETLFRTYVTRYLCCDSLIDTNVPLFGKSVRKEIRFATEEERQKLFDAINANGFKWNPETKTLEKLTELKENVDDKVVIAGIDFNREDYDDEVELNLGNYEIEVRDGKIYAVFKNTLDRLIEPKFKIGDKIKHKNTVLTIISVRTNSYLVEDEPNNFGILVFSQQDKWELINEPKFKVGDRIKYTYFDRKVAKIVKIHDKRYELDNGKFIEFQDENAYEISYDKFDINTLKPFESRVLVRDKDCYEWEGAVFGRYDGNTFFTIGGVDWKCCIPYEGNEHLHGTTNDCDDFYKIWKNE